MEFSGQSVQIGFLLTSQTDTGGASVGTGWYIDEVVIVTGSIKFSNPDGFELGLGNWAVDRGTWEVGTPTSGPGSAHDGTNCAATVLAGNYDEGVSSRLVSPLFVVPPEVANPRLRFWHWYNFGRSDSGRVQVSAGSANWQNASEQYSGSSSGVWSRPEVPLSEYAGKAVQLGFLLTSQTDTGGASVGPGWYIDEARLLHDFALLLLDSPIVRTQESACIRLGIAASTPASAVSFTLHAPVGHLGNLILNTEGCWSGGLAPLGSSQWAVSLTNSCSTAAMGVQTVGALCFTAVSAQSAFVPLMVSDLNAGVSPTHAFGSRAVIIANEPLLEASLGMNSQRLATVYGIAGRTYELHHTTSVDGSSDWTPGWTNTMPSDLFYTLPLAGSLSNTPKVFLRAKEQ
jgi:hypothetical protein